MIGVLVAHRGNVNNQGFGDCFHYNELNLVINDSDFVILGLVRMPLGLGQSLWALVRVTNQPHPVSTVKRANLLSFG